jgi:signal peptidase II
MGNIIDCVFYGRIFSESTYTQVATLFPAGGGYANWLHGRVVDMFSFSIFPPIFNFADAAITVGVFYMLIFQWKWLKTL